MVLLHKVKNTKGNTLSMPSCHLQITKPSLPKHVPIFGVWDVKYIIKFKGKVKYAEILW
jgi:hypothetical protein